MPSLLVVKSSAEAPAPGSLVELNKERFTIGRNPECDFVVAGTAVSREHAQILRANGLWYVKDLKSRNKTYVNNQEVNPEVMHKLREGDRIRICDCTWMFYDGGPWPPDVPRPTGSQPLDAGDDDVSSTVMSTLEPGTSSHSILETQPAERLRILLEITNSLARTLELEPLLPKILESLFQIFRQADRGFIIIRDEAGKIIPKATRTRREKDESSARFSRNIIKKCIEEGKAFLSEDAMSDDRFSLSQSISEFRIRSVMCAPLSVGAGAAFGVIQLDTQDRVKKFTPEDLQLLVAVCSQAAVAMENAKLHEESLESQRIEQEMLLAKQVQESVLPSQMPKLPGYDFFGFYKAARTVGGDFYNFVDLANGRLVIALGDVAGKGIPAALLMMKLNADVHTCVMADPDPVVAIGRLNGLLQSAGLLDRFVTFVLALLDTRSHKLTLVNAGHLVPILRSGATGKTEELAGGDLRGFPLGVMEGCTYQACEIEMKSGDSVVLYTDGITDTTNKGDEQFGVDRVVQVLKAGPSQPTALGKHLLNEVERFSTGRPQHDDITLVSFGRTA